MAWLFVFFFISGFCSILYELIWLRLAMADFAISRREGNGTGISVFG